MPWYEIMPLDELWIGEMLGVEAGGVKVLLINVEGPEAGNIPQHVDEGED